MAQPDTLVSSFDILFYICKFCGIYPQSLESFRYKRLLKPSKFGTIIVLAYMVVIQVLYNFLIYSFQEDETSTKESQSTLTFVIGLFLNYIAPTMLVIDQFTAILNQGKLGNFFDRIQSVDEKLNCENINLDNRVVKKRISFLIILTIFSEIIIMLATFFLLVDYSQWHSLFWIMSCVPTLLSVFDKIWFAALLFGLKQRFQAINDCLDGIVESHYQIQRENEPNHKTKFNMNLDNYINSEKRNKIFPDDKKISISTSINSFKISTSPMNYKMKNKLQSELSNTAKMEAKLTNFCQLHDEICELGKWLNELWSYPVLVLMAYGFLIFTAQLYFLYCGTQGQRIPPLFRSAKDALITSIYLLYTSGKCIYLIYLSWKTSLESKRTGVCLHKCGIAADNNELYEIVNHLSLKLLNHSVNFSACGFFTLDMETLYGVSGGITSYLIILIQFNLAAQQAREAVNTNSGAVTEASSLTTENNNPVQKVSNVVNKFIENVIPKNVTYLQEFTTSSSIGDIFFKNIKG